MPEGAIYAALKQVRTITGDVDTVSSKILDANSCRKGSVIFNDGPCSVYLTYGPVASLTTPTAIIGPYASWDMPGPSVWCGEISALREADTGPLVITEFI